VVALPAGCCWLLLLLLGLLRLLQLLFLGVAIKIFHV